MKWNSICSISALENKTLQQKIYISQIMVLNEYKNFHNDSIKIIWTMIFIFVHVYVSLYVRVCIRVGHITWKSKYQNRQPNFYEK